MLRSLVSLSVLSLLTLTGCRVNSHKNGDNQDVDIGTPFGSMHVKTDQNTTVETGLTPYPGATRVHKDGKDNGAADVNMSFGGFKLGVHAMELQTPDDQDKVIAFYKKDMGRYGLVLTCRGKQPVGTPVRTGEGLTCSTNGSHGEGDGDLELKAGSEQHQHIVGVHPDDGGTRIGLVALDLPKSPNRRDSEDRE